MEAGLPSDPSKEALPTQPDHSTSDQPPEDPLQDQFPEVALQDQPPDSLLKGQASEYKDTYEDTELIPEAFPSADLTPEGPGNHPVAPNQIPTDSEDELAVSRKWREFVDEVGRHGNATLISLLRNAVVMALDDQRLVIGFQNIQIFTDDKRALIEETAHTFFNPSIQVVFRESDDGLDDSLQVKSDIARAREHAATEEKARKDRNVLSVLDVFPEAEIDEIIILDEKENR